MSLIVTCPHCEQLILIAAINCRIFRHGVYKASGKQVNPHLPRAGCDRLVAANLIYGCGKPFQLVRAPGSGSWQAEACGYI